MFMKSLIKKFMASRLETSTTEEIIKKIAPYNIISFDIFDTLLKRDVPIPSDVFSIVENISKKIGFKDARIKAEVTCRRQSMNEEVSLDDIYRFMDVQYAECKHEELSVESSVLRKNMWFEPIYRYCRKQRKTILLTSDMYLPQEFIEKILQREGIRYDRLFLSSTEGVQKRTGNLYKREINTLKIHSKELVHIGDSLGSDWLGAKKAGVKTILIPRKIRRTILIDKKLDNNLDCYINNTIPSDKEYCWQLGYAALGPLLYGFITWLHDETKKRGLQKIYFFSRDGWLMKRAWEAIYGSSNNVQYIYISRRSVSVPILWKHSDWQEIGKYITMTRFFTVKSFLKRLGISVDNCKDDLVACRLTAETVFSKVSYLQDKRLEQLYNLVKEQVVSNSKQEYLGLCMYLKSVNFSGSVAVVDIGWNGSMQKNLRETLTEAGIVASLTGFYFGVKKCIQGLTMHGYLYDTKNRKLEGDISAMQGMFESFFLAKDGSTKRYHLKDGGASVEFYSPEYSDTDIERITFETIQEGALAFISAYQNSNNHFMISLTKADYFANIQRFGIKPSMKEIDRFCKFRFFDTNVVYMANPKEFTYYIRHPKQFLREFSSSVWKQAFLIKLFRLSLPWYYILYRMK